MDRGSRRSNGRFGWVGVDPISQLILLNKTFEYCTKTTHLTVDELNKYDATLLPVSSRAAHSDLTLENKLLQFFIECRKLLLNHFSDSWVSFNFFCWAYIFRIFLFLGSKTFNFVAAFAFEREFLSRIRKEKKEKQTHWDRERQREKQNDFEKESKRKEGRSSYREIRVRGRTRE